MGIGLPYLDKVKIVYFEDIGAQITAMQGGTVDMMQSIRSIRSRPQAGAEDVTFLSASGSSWPQLAMRMDQKPYDDKRIRQALAFAWTAS